MKYLIKKIWPLVLLLIASYAIVFIHVVGGFCYDFAEAYAIFATYVIAVGLLCQPLGRLLHPHYTGEGWFACHDWEDGGKFYDKWFKVSKYKDNVVNAALIFGKVSRETSTAHGASRTPDETSAQSESTAVRTPRMPRDSKSVLAIIDETCKSELVHWLLVLISPIMLALIHSWLKWVLWAAYLIANLKDIIIQRYNRPRFVKLYDRLKIKEAK